MRTYRRVRLPGATYFFTLTLAERRDNDLLVRHADALRAAFRDTLAEHPAVVEGIVILPEHLHCLWRLPPGDDDFPTRWRLIKTRYSRAILTGERISASRARRRERGIWQRRYWERRRGRLPAASGLHPLQPRQARACRVPAGPFFSQNPPP